MNRLIPFILLCAALSVSACNNETLDFDNPKVDIFVEQLKDGTYLTKNAGGLSVMPHFTTEDIEELLLYAEDLSLISSFPLAPISYMAGGKLRLGECILWTIESIRLGSNASLGCKMVHTDAKNYEGVYFLTDKEVLDAVSYYKRWWEARKLPRTMWTIDPCRDEPLCGSNYMWW